MVWLSSTGRSARQCSRSTRSCAWLHLARRAGCSPSHLGGPAARRSWWRGGALLAEWPSPWRQQRVVGWGPPWASWSAGWGNDGFGFGQAGRQSGNGFRSLWRGESGKLAKVGYLYSRKVRPRSQKALAATRIGKKNLEDFFYAYIYIYPLSFWFPRSSCPTPPLFSGFVLIFEPSLVRCCVGLWSCGCRCGHGGDV